MKKQFRVIGLVWLIFFISIFFNGYVVMSNPEPVRNPTLDLEHFSITDMVDLNTWVDLRTSVYNPNSIYGTVKELNFDIYWQIPTRTQWMMIINDSPNNLTVYNSVSDSIYLLSSQGFIEHEIFSDQFGEWLYLGSITIDEISAQEINYYTPVLFSDKNEMLLRKNGYTPLITDWRQQLVIENPECKYAYFNQCAANNLILRSYLSLDLENYGDNLDLESPDQAKLKSIRSTGVMFKIKGNVVISFSNPHSQNSNNLYDTNLYQLDLEENVKAVWPKQKVN